MIEIKSRPTPKGAIPLTSNKIYNEVLGVKPGHVRGLGYGVLTISSSSSTCCSRSEVDVATKGAEDVERQVNELARQIQAQRTEIKGQRQELNQMRAS